ncbi:hypothetical protein FO519_009712 [Halicephalobus sp. NKZ332]|nr:hypothetical protein FO519_009712 [Halicephalobus sp. NKZ332]
MRLGSLLILAFSVAGIGAQTPCSGSGTGTWTAWTNSTACADCETAGTPANGVYRMRLCVPPKGSSCIYDTYSCSANCGEWAEWSCACCGGCGTSRCRRGWLTDGSACPAPVGSPSDFTKEDTSNACVSPSQVCPYPLTICCDGQMKYVNMTSKSFWCKNA